jgi:hypothetical protein
MIDQFNMSNNPDLFVKNKYVHVKNVLTDDMIGLISQYALFDERRNFSLEQGPDPQIHNSHSSYADPLMESLMLYMHPIMEKNTGLTLYPTYSYYRVYRPGAELKKHKDRPSCEVSTTVMLGIHYKDAVDYTWPIFMEGTECTMEPGDIVIYRGCDVEHWREEFKAPEGSFHIQAFLHYVDANGPYPEFKWDKRMELGINPRLTFKTETTPKTYITYTE